MTEKIASRYACILLLAVVALTRMPFLSAGYETNIDAWRVAHAARIIAQSGEYEASRLPGYPVHEIICSWFWQGGPVALNTLSAAFSAAAVLAIWMLARRMQCHDSMLLALAAEATPVFFLSSVTSKDYIWAIAFLLWALYAAVDRRPLLCGLLFGLAIGCRITSAAMFLPLAMVLYGGVKATWKSSLLRFAACGSVVATLMFLPVWMRYGWHFFSFYESHARPDIPTVLNRATIEVWGILGMAGLLLALGAILIRGHVPSRTSLPAPLNRFLTPAMIMILVIYSIAFLRLPDQAGYLLPIVPAFLFLMARFAPRLVFQIACACLCVSPWADFKEGKLGVGAIVADHRERLKTLQDVGRFVALTDDALPGENTVVVGAWAPIISELFAENCGHNRYVYLLSRNDLEELIQERRGIAYSGNVIREFNSRVHGVDLASYGARNVRQILLGQP